MYLAPQLFSGDRRRAGGTYLLGASLSRRPVLRRHSFAYLSALTPDQAAEQIFPEAKVGKSAGHNQGVRDSMVQAATSGQLSPAYLPGTGDCAGVKASAVTPVLTTIGGTAIKFAGATGPAAPFVFAAGAVMDAVGFITGIFGAHHAAAVAKERGTLCVEVPAANNALQAIDQAVQQGLMTPAQGQQALDSVVTNFQSSVSGIIQGSDPTSSGECNAACVMLSELRTVVNYQKSVYQDMITAAAANPAGAVGTSLSDAVASLGLPPWAAAVAAFGVLYSIL